MTHVPASETPGPDHRAVTPNAVISSPLVRKYIYLAVAAIVAGLIVFGLITEEQVQQWVQLTVALVGLGASVLAAVNTPPGS